MTPLHALVSRHCQLLLTDHIDLLIVYILLLYHFNVSFLAWPIRKIVNHCNDVSLSLSTDLSLTACGKDENRLTKLWPYVDP